MTRRFTGWHMVGIMLGIFGVVIAVNLLMARYAISTFGGTVVDNSYVASQRFNHWLAEARSQKALGWTLDVGVNGDRRVELGVHASDGALTGAIVTAQARHPLGLEPDRALRFTSAGDGRYLSREPLPAGRWLLRISVARDGRIAHFDDQVPA